MKRILVLVVSFLLLLPIGCKKKPPEAPVNNKIKVTNNYCCGVSPRDINASVSGVVNQSFTVCPGCANGVEGIAAGNFSVSISASGVIWNNPVVTGTFGTDNKTANISIDSDGHVSSYLN